jgi:peptidoglycan LD-endopeptidase CwlK
MTLVDQIKTVQRFHGLTADGMAGSLTWAAIFADVQKRAGVHVDAPSDVDATDLDARTMKNIRTLDVKCQERFIQFSRLAKATAASFGCDYVMISGHRTWEEQDALFEKRPKVTNAAGGYSNHNFGIAGDYGVFRGKVYLDDSNPALAEQVHAACAVHARKLGFEWGGDWARFKDFPHYEISTGLTLGAKRMLYKKEGSVL